MPFNRLVIIGFALVVLFLVWLVINRTRMGLFVRGVTQNRAMASCTGVPTHRVDMLTFGLGSGVAGLGGVALSQIGNVGPDLGQSYIVDSFMVVVLGGVGQLAGTVIAAFGLGSVAKFLEPFSGAVLAKIVVLIFIILFIQKRPAGPVRPQGPERRGMDVTERCSARSAAVWTAHLRRRPRVVLLVAIVPLAAPGRPRGSPLYLSSFWITLLGKFMCYAVVALAMDLIWGYTGILSLGQGVFFALGGYMFGMYLMRQIGLDGVYKSELPDFMVFLDWKAFPWYWAGSDSFAVAVVKVIAVPGLLAFVFGFFAFRSRIKGVYFSIITQALTFAAMLAFFRNDMGFGGNNGFTDFKRILGYAVQSPQMRTTLYVLSGLYLLGGAAAGALDRQQQVRPRADRDPRPGVAADVPRLPHDLLQAGHLDARRDPQRHRRRALRAAGRHHQPERDEPGELDRDRDLGRGRRARHAVRADPRRVRGQRRQELVHGRLPRVLAVLPRAGVRPRDAVPAERTARPVPQAARTAPAARRAGRRRTRRSRVMGAR